MTTCTAENGTSLQCSQGCCGAGNQQECCSYTLSESTLIIICVIGSALIIAILSALIVCITNKQKNSVTRITPRQRRQFTVREASRREADLRAPPPPPPYTDLPPQYDSIIAADNPDLHQIPGSTIERVPRQRLGDVPMTRVGNTTQEMGVTRSHVPPPYTSVVNNNTTSTSQNQESGHLELLGLSRPLHRSESERSVEIAAHAFRSRLSHGHGNNSVSPLTIREISVVNETQRDHTSGSIRNTAGTSYEIRRTCNILGSNQLTRNRILNSRTASNSTNKNTPTGHSTGATLWPESPTNLTTTAAQRSAQRRAVIEKLQIRKDNAS
ncbi:hypothetical protein MAR_024998 [Mya arenaria]|uniref:Uncharacterized protein n=1 Tax=Mya arenaria TaxID=6604 RepID=A0ABY7E0D7_MYAAR|nr:uncharacterized protein LOC128227365 [Mya arenaria]WAR00626.1 hypothetical protein MAR_024998 [Mya arenaria]